MHNYLNSCEITDYCEYIGLRYDEEPRVFKAKNNPNNENRILRFPLYNCGVTQSDVLNFWQNMPFNLRLKPWESNCDLCFLKGTKIKQTILENNPELLKWWIDQETLLGKTFSKIPYRHLKTIVDNQENLLPCNCTD
jgi:hypothetical protein